MGVAKAKASVKGRNAFRAGFLYTEMQINLRNKLIAGNLTTAVSGISVPPLLY